MPETSLTLGELIIRQSLLALPVQLVYAFILYLFAKREGRWGVQVVLALIPFVGFFWFGLYMLRMQLRVLNRLNALEARLDQRGHSAPDPAALRRMSGLGSIPR
jgi:hypothetical protein